MYSLLFVIFFTGSALPDAIQGGPRKTSSAGKSATFLQIGETREEPPAGQSYPRILPETSLTFLSKTTRFSFSHYAPAVHRGPRRTVGRQEMGFLKDVSAGGHEA